MACGDSAGGLWLTLVPSLVAVDEDASMAASLDGCRYARGPGLYYLGVAEVILVHLERAQLPSRAASVVASQPANKKIEIKLKHCKQNVV